MSGITGSETARRMLQSRGINDVQVNAVHGTLSDHYSSWKRTLNLSESNYEDSSIAAVAVAAHEAAHAMQHAEGYIPLILRNLLAPVVSAA